MKKLIPFVVSGILLIGTIGCQEATKTGSETGTTNEAGAPAKEASQTTDGTIKNDGAIKNDSAIKGGTDTKSLVNSKLTEKIPGSKLAAQDKDGVVTVTGTVPSEADIKKIEPAVKEVKGVKSVKVEAKVGSAK